MDPYAYPVMAQIFGVVFWATPALFLLQLIALLVLLWRVLYRWSLGVLGERAVERWVLGLGVAVAPSVMLFMTAGFSGGYQEERGHWFFHMHDGLAGLALVPVYSLGSCIVGWGIARRDYRLRSGTHWVVLWTLVVVSLWYAFATAFLDMTADETIGLNALAVVPAVAAINYVLLALDIERQGLLALDIERQGRLQAAPASALIAWFSALVVSLMVKVPLAMRLYDALPVKRPDGYGDCFVVGAATRGHRAIVGSRFDTSLGRTVNHQWRTLRTFEDRLTRRHPALHRHLRAVYNRIGPPVAAGIRSPLAADLVYLLLKPAEWFARLYLTLTK